MLGLVPSWAKDPAIGSRMINARAETVASKPAYRRAFTKRRRPLPADGDYAEPYRPGEDARRPSSRTSSTGRTAPRWPSAGLDEFWRDQAHPDDHPDAWLVTATIITTSAPDQLGVIHERMPMVIPPGQWAEWAGSPPSGSGPAGAPGPSASSGLVTTRVSTKVNSVRNNGPELIEPGRRRRGQRLRRGAACPRGGLESRATTLF